MRRAAGSVGAAIAVVGTLALAVDWARRRRYRTGGPGAGGDGPWPAGDREPRSPLPTAGSGAAALDAPGTD